MADRAALTNQVVFNIISNAIKYSRPNGEIFITCEQDRKEVRLCIKDHGTGIDKDRIQPIFFSQELISTRGTFYEAGSGMGTSLAREYMKMFRGEIMVDSVHELVSAQSGTVVTLCFPRAV